MERDGKLSQWWFSFKWCRCPAHCCYGSAQDSLEGRDVCLCLTTPGAGRLGPPSSNTSRVAAARIRAIVVGCAAGPMKRSFPQRAVSCKGECFCPRTSHQELHLRARGSCGFAPPATNAARSSGHGAHLGGGPGSAGVGIPPGGCESHRCHREALKSL